MTDKTIPTLPVTKTDPRRERADQDLALEKAKLHLIMQLVDERRAEREKAKEVKANA